MTTDDWKSQAERLAQAMRDHEAKKGEAAELAAKVDPDFEQLKAETRRYWALPDAEKIEVLKRMGDLEGAARIEERLRARSKAPKPLDPVRIGNYVPRRSTEVARWHLWRVIPTAELWQAVALSLNIEPLDSLREDAKRGPPVHSMRGMRSRLPNEFFDRLSVCKRALSTNGPIRPQGSLYSGVLQDPCCRVLLAEVAAFLVLAEFTVPDEMRAMVPKVADMRAATEPVAAVAGPEQPASKAAPVAAASAPADPERGEVRNKGWVLKRAALISKHRLHWPTIERDLRDAAENKLSDAAKATTHGDWYEAAALEWATARGKIADADGPAPVNSVWNLPGTKHTM